MTFDEWFMGDWELLDIASMKEALAATEQKEQWK